MVNCVAADVKVYTGTAISDADLGYMIGDADKVIAQFFLTRGGKTPGADAAKQASILLVRSNAAGRLNLTGEAPASYTSGDWSQSGVQDSKQIDGLREQAYQIMRDELGRLDVPYTAQEDIQRTDSVMEDFKLDQSDLPEFFEELTS